MKNVLRYGCLMGIFFVSAKMDGNQEMNSVVAKDIAFVSTISPISSSLATVMKSCSWKPECPIPLEELAYLTLSHWGYDGKVHEGELVVHKKLAREVVAIFKELFEGKFPIERMRLIDYYEADDEASMADNDSSAFCFRANTTRPGVFSHHSYGIAIDINPLINPYVRGTLVLPSGGKHYLDRMVVTPGLITDAEDNVCYQAFSKRGWEWGGHWEGRMDYQHFSKSIDFVQN